jgi:hypothetical protein
MEALPMMTDQERLERLEKAVVMLMRATLRSSPLTLEERFVWRGEIERTLGIEGGLGTPAASPAPLSPEVPS